MLIFSGAGPIGLVTLLAAHAAGCTPIAITDLIGSRLEFAKTLVPSVKTIQLERSGTAEGNAERIKEALGMMPRVALECTGFESSIRAAIYVSWP
jgi:L-iditol 2-dehydrogenase